MAQSSDTFLEMWQTLFGVLNKTFEEQNERDMQTIFGMIRNRLVFESPGIFPGKILNPSDEERTQACNFWLIHKLINILLQERFSNFHGDILGLLKDILAGCMVKQRWLFNSTLKTCLKLAKDLLALHPPDELVIDHFTVTQYDLTRIDRKVYFSPTRVSAGAPARRLLDFVVQILTGASHVEEASRCVMEVLNKGHLSSKLCALEYFKEDFKHFQPPLSTTQKTQQLGVLLAIENMLKNLPFWLSMEKFAAPHIQNIQQTLTELFQIFKGLVKLTKKSDCRVFFKILLRIIETFHSMHEDVYQRFKSYGQIFITYGVELISHASLDLETKEVERIIEVIPKDYEVIKLLELTVYKELQNNQEGDTILTRSKTWRKICSFLSGKSPEEDNLDEYLLLFNEMLQMGVKIALKTSTKCFGSDLNNIIDLFMRSTELSTKFVFQDTRLLILIAQDIISLPDFQDSDEKRQRFVLEVIFSPLAKVLKRQSRVLPDGFLNQKQSMLNEQERLEFESVRTLFSIREDTIPRSLLIEVKKTLRDVLHQHQKLSFDSQVCLFPLINSAIARNLLTPRDVQESFMEKVLRDEKFHVYISQSLKQLICILSGRFSSETFHRGSSRFKCFLCEEYSQYSRQNSTEETSEDFLNQFLQLFSSKNEEVIFNMIECIMPLLVHLPRKLLNISLWLPLLQHERQNIQKKFAFTLPQLVENIYKWTEDESRREGIIRECQESLLQMIVTTVQKKTKCKNHHSALLLLEKFSEYEHFPEHVFLHCFNMVFLFVINTESLVASDASILGRDMCLRRRITPRDMLNWYKEDVLKIIVTLCVGIFQRNDMGLYQTLTQTAKMMGYAAAREFISEHFRLIVAMLLPYCVQDKNCERLLQDVCQHVRQDLSEVLSAAFVTIYTYLFLSQSPEINNKCIDYVLQNTSQTLYHLLHSDIKRTIPEVLVYYHKNPKFVMHAFQSLLSKNEVTLRGVADYISSRFLGVLTTFESLIVSSDTEKALKKKTLLSLGEIVRFMGPEHITQYRFKILTLLKTAAMINDDIMKKITASVWTIFLRTVDVQSLGPLLSTIIVSLEPLLPHQPQQVSEIFNYLIIENRSLLSSHFGDLFFIEETHLEDSVKAIVSSQRRSVQQSFAEQFDIFRKHINHENLEVRTYGFRYLSRLFAENRSAFNKMVYDNVEIDSILMGCIDTMMQGCRHIDENLQLASGMCLGELGALEPSHLPPNYAPQNCFATTIHSDEFAIMALAELCRAYQFQKNSHCVDSFSLAIQEILQARGVDPREQKKVAVWQAIPERMRQLMEPLLTSCYTGLPNNVYANIHPVFGSSKCHSLEHWTFIWASNMILGIQDGLTKHLLNSFRPSIKYDMQTMAMFLPYIILHALLTSNEEHRTRITEEFHQVFTTAASIDENDQSTKIERRCRGIRSVCFVPTDDTVERESKEDMVIKCAKMAFNQLDFLEVWLKHCQSVQDNPSNNAQTTLIRKFVDQFEPKLLAKANFNSGEYARSLQFLEQYISKNPNKLQEELPFLAEIYAELMDPDNVEGAIGLMTEKLPLPEQIAMNTVTGRVAESSVCFEKLMQMGDITPSLMNSLVQYYVALDQPETALLVSESLLHKFEDFNVDKLTLEMRAEPLWKMGRFEDLKELITGSQLEESDGWGVRCGALLLSYREERDTFADEMRKARLSILKSLRCAEIEQNTYQKGYSDVLKLHMVTEIEKAFEMIRRISESMSEEQGRNIMERFFNDWEARIHLLQPSTRIVEPVLQLRRILLTQGRCMILKHCGRNSVIKNLVDTKINKEIGKLWLKSAELARKEGLYQQAQLHLLNLEDYRMKDSFLERAKLLWSRGDQPNTFQVLERGLGNLLESGRVARCIDLPRQERLLYAEGKFLIASYNAEAMNIETELNVSFFREAIEAFPECEKSLVYYGQFLDKIFNSLPEDQQIVTKGTDLQKEIMNAYGTSLQFGCNYLFQSMPRLLSIWLDYTALVAGCDKRVSKQMTELALRFSNTLPSYMFFTAFSQLVSRICHPSIDVYQVLRTILIKLILDYPQQSLWMILSVLKSSYASRSKRCIEVLNDQRLKEPPMQRLITDFNRLAERLIELTNKNIPNHVKDPKVSNLVPQLPMLFKDANFSKIVIPAQKFMQPELPSTSERDAATNEHNAFPRRMFYIQSIKNSIVILRSLQRPRKIVLLADDGLEYSVLMKPKDDLRKDFRLMEFNAVVKQYLRQDPEARRRRLDIRTYSVLPLNEECGIIEWVSNLMTLRSILLNLYRCHGIATDLSDLKKIEAARDRTGKTGKTDIFVNILCKRHPPIFDEWFKTTFTTPFNWYQARSSYIRTTAVMSIVGYILGLGDRHGENILYDHTNGDTVHVDFNCLFNKGESLGVPEVVPFRLTHNMVHAMGPLGVQGLYRKCCEVTLRVLQEQTSTLMSVLRPFVYDPLVSWHKKEKDRMDGTRERTDPQALTNLNHIEERLKGFVKINGRRAKMPLSTEGQVNFVINEATDVANLSAMYIGWGAFM